MRMILRFHFGAIEENGVVVRAKRVVRVRVNWADIGEEEGDVSVSIGGGGRVCGDEEDSFAGACGGGDREEGEEDREEEEAVSSRRH